MNKEILPITAQDDVEANPNPNGFPAEINGIFLTPAQIFALRISTTPEVVNHAIQNGSTDEILSIANGG